MNLNTIRTQARRFVGPSDANLPPLLAGADPVIGHSREFMSDPVGLLYRGYRAHGEAFTIKLMGANAVPLTGPEGNEAFFRAPEDVLDAKEAYRIMTPVFGKGIAYDAEPHIMDEQLAFLYPALREKNLREYARKMNEEAERYFKRFGDEGEFDLLDMGNELTMYTSTRSLLGDDFRDKLDSHFAHLYHDLDSSLTPLAFFLPNLPIPKFIKRDRARAALVKLFEDIVAERRQSGERHDDMLQALMDAQYKDGRKLTGDEITGLILTIIFAGHHTSGTLTAWIGAELYSHQNWLPAVLDEQRRVYANNRPVSFDSLKELVELERVIMEAERMHPPIVVMMRKALKTFEYKNWKIPAGTLLMTSPAVSHRLPGVFADPNTFDPGRFAPGREEHKKSPYGMITFGAGKHRCIGLHFAYMQLKAVWSHLLRNFELELSSPSYVPNYESMLVGPKQPATVRFKRRKVVLGCETE
ncbi:MAG: sterol 14-demethylase [Myxococcota bacterium]|jgi:sterol 14-demethylase